MLSEIFRRLRPFQPVEEYVYVGLGSVWFSDFLLFHRALGIGEMISIERSSGAQARFEANKPFSNIKMDFQESSAVLPRLDWTRRHFLWLDYDDPISEGMLLDVSTVASRAPSGTLLAASMQCHRAREFGEADDDPAGPTALARFRDRFGPARVPADLYDDDLVGWPFGTVSRRMLVSEIQTALVSRNMIAPQHRQIRFHHICDLEYEDGVRMTTFVGVFASEEDQRIVEECGFDHLDFMRGEGQVRRIRVPNLTIREIRHLERQLPAPNPDNLDIGAIPRKEAECFADLYRYLPNFAVLET